LECWSTEIKELREEVTEMAITFDPEQIVSNNELLMSQIVSSEAVIRLLIEKGVFTKEEFLEMVNVVDSEIGKNGVVSQMKGG